MAINSSNLNFQPGIPPATPVTTALVPEAKTDLSSSVIPDGVMLSGTAQEVLDRAKANYLPNPATFWEAPLEQTTCQGEFPKPPNQDNFLQRRIKRLGYNAGRVFRSVGDGLGNEVGNSIRNPMRWTPVLGPSIRRLEAAGLPTPAPLVSLPGQEFVANTAESAIRGVGEFTASTSEDVTYAVAHPDKTLQGAYMVTNTLLANDPTMGPSIIQLESLATGKSYPEVWAEKRQNADNLKQAVVQDFNQTRDRVGLPGALVKLSLIHI